MYSNSADAPCFFLLHRWTRREEADFYRVVSTFGVVFDPELGRFDWTKFRAMARLHKKTDESLHKYLCAFTAMCRRVCRLPPREGGESDTHTHTLTCLICMHTHSFQFIRYMYPCVCNYLPTEVDVM